MWDAEEESVTSSLSLGKLEEESITCYFILGKVEEISVICYLILSKVQIELLLKDVITQMDK
jgi:hypothetical protein